MAKNLSSPPKLVVVEESYPPQTPESILSSHDFESAAASPQQHEGPIVAEVVEATPLNFQEQVVFVTQVPGAVQQEQVVTTQNPRLADKLNEPPQQVVMPMSSSFFNISSVQESRVNLVLWVASNPPVPGQFLQWIRKLKKRIADEGKFSIECCKKCEEKRLVDMFIYANKNRGHLIIEFMESAALKEEPDYDDLLSFCAHKDEEGGTATYAHNDDDELDMIPKKHKARVELTVWTTQEEPTDVNLSFSEWLREVKDVVSTEGMYSEECCKNCDDLRVFDLFVLRHRKDKALLWELFSSMTTGKADFIDFVVFCHSMDTNRLSASRRKRSFNNVENNGLVTFNSPAKRDYNQQGINLRDDVSSIGSPAYGSVSTISKTPPSFHGSSSMARSMSNASGNSISSGYTSLDDSVHTSFKRVPMASTPMPRGADRSTGEGQNSTPSVKDLRFMEYQIRTTNYKGIAVNYPGHEGKSIQWREMDAEYFRELMHRYPKEEFGEKRAELVYEALQKKIPMPVITSRLLSFDKKGGVSWSSEEIEKLDQLMKAHPLLNYASVKERVEKISELHGFGRSYTSVRIRMGLLEKLKGPVEASWGEADTLDLQNLIRCYPFPNQPFKERSIALSKLTKRRWEISTIRYRMNRIEAEDGLKNEFGTLVSGMF